MPIGDRPIVAKSKPSLKQWWFFFCDYSCTTCSGIVSLKYHYMERHPLTNMAVAISGGGGGRCSYIYACSA